MIERLKRDGLQQHRTRSKTTMMNRVVNSLIAIQLPPQFSQLGAAARGHQLRYRIPFCRTTVYNESFVPSTIRIWNQLPEDIIMTQLLESFKSGVQGYIVP
jgi:hypothetical protein